MNSRISPAQKFRMFAALTVDTNGKANWSLNEGESAADVRDTILRAGPTWNPPTHYNLVRVRELTADERKALRRDPDGLQWWAEHNPPAPTDIEPTAEDYRADMGTDLPTHCQYFAPDSGPVAQDGSLLPPCPNPVDAAVEPRPAGQFAPAFLCAEHANDWIDDHAFHLGTDWVVAPMSDEGAARLTGFPHTAPVGTRTNVCDTTTEDGGNCGLTAGYRFDILVPGDIFEIDHTLYVCESHLREMLVWVAENEGSFDFRVLGR